MKALKTVKYACVLVIVLTFLLSPAVSFGEPIKIGAMFISSGPMGGYGIHGRQAIELAIEQINTDGGVLGPPGHFRIYLSSRFNHRAFAAQAFIGHPNSAQSSCP